MCSITNEYAQLATRPSALRLYAFYFALMLPIVAYILIVVPSAFDETHIISQGVLDIILRISPILGSDLSIFGEVTPFLLAGSIIALMPIDDEKSKTAAVIICFVIYLLYIHLSLYFSSGVGAGILASIASNVEIAKKSIISIVSNVRTMSVVVAASILGFKLKY